MFFKGISVEKKFENIFSSFSYFNSNENKTNNFSEFFYDDRHKISSFEFDLQTLLENFRSKFKGKILIYIQDTFFIKVLNN